MPDYILKKQVLDMGLDKIQKRLSKQIYLSSNNPDKLKQLDKLWWENLEKYGNLWLESKKINAAFYSRSRRLWKRIYALMITGQCLFLTMTFTDKILNTTTYEIRRRYVREYLKSQSDYYIANIDFGEQNGREHYHAIILSDGINYHEWHRFGAIKGLKVHNGIDDAKRLSKYVSKLTNHAIKETTGQNRIIYGRKMHIFD